MRANIHLSNEATKESDSNLSHFIQNVANEISSFVLKLILHVFEATKE